jgi:hypothetical protein
MGSFTRPPVVGADEGIDPCSGVVSRKLHASLCRHFPLSPDRARVAGSS